MAASVGPHPSAITRSSPSSSRVEFHRLASRPVVQLRVPMITTPTRAGHRPLRQLSTTATAKISQRMRQAADSNPTPRPGG